MSGALTPATIGLLSGNPTTHYGVAVQPQRLVIAAFILCLHTSGSVRYQCIRVDLRSYAVVYVFQLRPGSMATLRRIRRMRPAVTAKGFMRVAIGSHRP